ncbi:hypothetical protein X922_17750 [Pseudomonas aeruginosa VRFPA08]|nr:hypothetical protein X922_17750 [Pseudomonas aeruginosa VRFPA08]
MKLNHVLQTAGYSMVVHPDGSIDVDGKRFVYEGASRKEKVYKLRLLGEDKQWSLPILTPARAESLAKSVAGGYLPPNTPEDVARYFEKVRHLVR